MATYVNNLRLKEIATGAESGTWGTSTNTNLELIADALGSGTEAITTNADTHTTTVADGAADEGRALFLKYTGTLDSACTITLAPNTINKVWFIENATSGSQNIIISQGSGANITIGNGKVAAIYTDGAAGSAAVLDVFADLELSSTLSVAGATSFTGVTTHGDDVVSDTDSTDDLGTTGVRWANLWVDAVTSTDTVTSASLVGALTGNASTATALETARTIGGTSFNGTANIAVALAAEATALATARTIGGTSFDGTANIAVALAAEATALETARTIGGTSFDGTANIAVALATLATTLTITDNESTNENNAIVFTAGGDIDGGDLGLESDGTLTYNPSTGKITTTAVDTQTLVVDGISTLTGAFTVTSTGPSAIGGTADGRIATLIGGAYTSDGSGNLAVGTALQHALTGAAGDTGSLAIAHIRGNINTQSATESIGVVASLKVDEPIIVDNLGGSGVVTVAATIYITAAPTEGTASAALYVKAGHIIHAAMTTSDPSVAGAFWNDSGTVKISSG